MPLSLQELSDRIEIDDLLTRYAVGVDRKDWDLWETCFTHDALHRLPRLRRHVGQREGSARLAREDDDDLPDEPAHGDQPRGGDRRRPRALPLGLLQPDDLADARGRAGAALDRRRLLLRPAGAHAAGLAHPRARRGVQLLDAR